MDAYDLVHSSTSPAYRVIENACYPGDIKKVVEIYWSVKHGFEGIVETAELFQVYPPTHYEPGFAIFGAPFVEKWQGRKFVDLTEWLEGQGVTL